MKKLIVLVAILAASCATVPHSPGRPMIGASGFDVAGMDRSVAACHDFYQYAVGNWRRTHPLPPAFSRFGRFEEVAERNRLTLRTILEESSRSSEGSPSRKLGHFYSSCMNEEAIEAAGIRPIAGELSRIDAIRTREQVQDQIFRMQQGGFRPLFFFGADNDYLDSSKVIASLSQGGLGLPDRDYYLRDDERFSKVREQYAAHLAAMFVLAGVPKARAVAEAGRVIAIETELARASMSRVEMRNPEKLYNVTSMTELAQLTPGIGWKKFFDGIGLAGLASVNVEQPPFFRSAAQLLDEAPVDSWKAYLRWVLIDASAQALPRAFGEESFNFRGRVLSGQQQQQQRWQRCVRATDSSLGQLLGQEYVRRAFTPEAKRRVGTLIDNLVAALREDIPRLDWMGPATKEAALQKLEAFSRRIGYPDKWIDYGTLEIGPGDYLANTFAARAFAFQRAVGRIGKPDDPDEWGFFTPPTVNAGYNPARNSITFPAGILQPPFYDPNADDAYNYGGIGTVIGHEMTHGFDDEGARFDARGNLRDWWTPEDLENFQARAACIARQYDAFVVEPGVNIQGKLVTGEAIADLGGVTLALRAYEKSLEGKPRVNLDGFTPEQRFFLGFAQVWAENMAPEEQRRRALTDPHAQGPFRVNATVANMPEFQEAFGCPEGTAMVRGAGKRCTIW